MNKRESILQDTTYYLPSNFLGQFIALLRGIIVRGVLGPLNYGWLYIFNNLILKYTSYTDIGLINAMDREVPLRRGRKENTEEKEIEDNVFSCVLILSIIIGAAIFIYSIVTKKTFFPGFSSVLKIFAVFLVLHRLSTFFSIFLRTHKKFKLLSKLNVLRAAAALVFIMLFAKRFQLSGIFGAEIIALILFLILCMRGFSHPFSISFNLKRIRNLIGIGFPLLLLSFVAITIRSVDIFMVTLLKAPVLLGYYSVGRLFSNTIVQIPDSISVILFPRLLEDFGRSPDVSKIKKYVEEPTVILAYLMGITIAMALLISPLFLKYILPQYQPGLVPLRIICAGAFFMSLVNMSGHFLIAVNKQHQLLGIGGGAVVLEFLLSFILIKQGLGITGIAIATAVVYFVYNTVVIAYASRLLQKGGRDILSFFLKIYFPFLYLTPWVIALHRLGRLSGPWGVDLGITALRMAGALIASIPFLIYLEKNHSLFKGLKRALWRK
jgi:O-antigen/teichoic acid export membrane protein